VRACVRACVRVCVCIHVLYTDGQRHTLVSVYVTYSHTLVSVYGVTHMDRDIHSWCQMRRSEKGLGGHLRVRSEEPFESEHTQDGVGDSASPSLSLSPPSTQFYPLPPPPHALRSHKTPSHAYTHIPQGFF
jgi:hypothetical protein